MYIQIGYTISKLGQYTKYSIANGTKSDSNDCKNCRNSEGSSGYYDKTPVACPSVAAAIAGVINTSGPVAIQCTPLRLFHKCSNRGAITIVNRVLNAT